MACVKGLCFDIDGTLCDTDDQWVSRLVSFLSPFSFLFRYQDPQPFARAFVMMTESPLNGFYHLLDHFSLDASFALLYNNFSKMRKRKNQSFLLMNGARELLEFVKNFFPLSVVSARDDLSANGFLDQFKLREYFCEIVTSQICEFTKPFPHPVLFAARSMHVDPKQCIMIGDTTVDILAGKAAGSQTIGVLCGFGTEEELKKAGADLIVEDLFELKKYFEVNKKTV